MITIRIVTELTVPEGVDSAAVFDRFQDLVEAAVRENDLTPQDSDVLFDLLSGEDQDGTGSNPDWPGRFAALEMVLESLTLLKGGGRPSAAGHWQPGPDGDSMSMPVSVGDRLTDTATVQVRFESDGAHITRVTCTDHTGKAVARWDGREGETR